MDQVAILIILLFVAFLLFATVYEVGKGAGAYEEAERHESRFKDRCEACGRHAPGYIYDGECVDCRH